MDTDSFIFTVKTDDFFKNISKDIDKWFDTSGYSKDIDRPFEKGKNKKVIGKFKDELGGRIMSKFCALRAKTYACKLDDGSEEKKPKGIKQCVVKNTINFDDYVEILFSENEKLLRSQDVFRSYYHTVYTEKVNKVAVSANDDKRIQKITLLHNLMVIMKNQIIMLKLLKCIQKMFVLLMKLLKCIWKIMKCLLINHKNLLLCRKQLEISHKQLKITSNYLKKS